MLAAPPAAAFDLELYQRLLREHTREVSDAAGVRVDYAALRRSEDWRRLVASLSASDPAQLAERSQRLAFWIDAYNVLAIELVVRNQPRESIRDIGTLFSPVWKREAGRIAGRPYSLDEIEHAILRPLGEPRIHAAIVCASVSCPSLAREPYRAETLDAQLDASLRRFLADPRKGSRLDAARGALVLSLDLRLVRGGLRRRRRRTALPVAPSPRGHTGVAFAAQRARASRVLRLRLVVERARGGAVKQVRLHGPDDVRLDEVLADDQAPPSAGAFPRGARSRAHAGRGRQGDGHAALNALKGRAAWRAPARGAA